MMTKPRFFLTIGLLIVLLASCAPAAVTESPAQPAAPVAVEPSATPFTPSEPTLAPPTEAVAVATEAIAPTPFPVATSRGPNLEATDPRTVSLASGGLQFIEFFRFT
jgi:hypothetical protein